MTTNQGQANATPLRRLSCRIDANDVEEMLDTYDSGMCDLSKANCICRVISRLLPADPGLRLVRLRDGRADLEIHGHRVPLPADLFAWLVAAETGARFEPIEIVLHLPGPGLAGATIARGDKPRLPEAVASAMSRPAPAKHGREMTSLPPAVPRNNPSPARRKTARRQPSPPLVLPWLD